MKTAIINRYWIYLKIIALIAIPIILILLPADYFDYGQTLCPSKRWMNFECLGCGLTRGIQHLIHLDFETAWLYNKLSPFILLLMIYFWFKWLKQAFKDLKT